MPKLKTIALILSVLIALSSCKDEKPISVVSNRFLELSVVNGGEVLWSYTAPGSGKTVSFAFPEIEIDGTLTQARMESVKLSGQPRILHNGVAEYLVEGNLLAQPDILLRMFFRVSDQSPIVRFRYEFISSVLHRLTKTEGSDRLRYLGFSVADFSTVKEIRFSEFNEMVHSFCLSERTVEPAQFADSARLMGPGLFASDGEHSLIMAYEHGSQVPDKYLEFRLSPDRSVTVNAVKGNYYAGYPIEKDHSFQTIWFDAGLVEGDETATAGAFRDFLLKYMSQNSESRKPYIFYNTWNFQERNKHWYKKPYLADMTLDRMLKEIEAAHQMGIEVFVIDAGWFEKTGDWQPSLKRFPDGLKTISKTLKEKGMKLGLWFNPTVAAVSSNMLKNNRECVRTMNGSEGKPWPIWETEESYGMCLNSAYRDAFANELIRLNKELGVTYFKWDAIGQYECNDPRHYHGNEQNTAQERLDCYAFELSKSMSYVVDKLTEACPEAIVDFDITEGGRAVGLGFLSSGKYFLINNGPYFFNYNIPFDQNGQWNIFFYPGPARTWICRTPLTYDKWIPTSLFLTHYLPDDPIGNQSLAVGSLILGQNGIWGDLPAISEEGRNFFAKTLTFYKQVRDDMTSVAMTRDGAVGGSPEIYEKINPGTGRGAIVIFSSHAGSYTYISKNKVAPEHWENEGVKVTIDQSGRARITADFKAAEAKILFFGVR